MNRLCTLVAAAVLAAPAAVFAGQNAEAAPASSGGGEKAAPAPSAPAAPSGGSSGSSSGSGGGMTSGSHGGGGTYNGGGGHAGPRAGAMGGSGAVTTSRGTGRTQESGGDHGTGVPRHSRPSEGKPITGTAGPRGPNNPRPGNTPVYVIPGYYGGYGFYDPWLYGGMFSGYYGGYYDPWFGGGYVPQSGYSYGSATTDEGSLKLKIKPKEAEVYVDGYYVGIVDDFDGALQHLNLTAGPHQIEIRAPGLPPVQFEVNVTPGQTITYHAGPY